jgi:CheY-like chemotaxis protein
MAKKKMKKSILIIEDEKKSREALRRYFKRDFDVKIATDGLEAFKILEKGSAAKYSCIILDLNMPNMSGIELLSKFNENNISIPPVIILSAFLDKETVQKCIKLGSKFNFEKPTETEKIEKIVDLYSGSFSFNKESIDKDVKSREESLLEYFKNSVKQNDFNVEFYEEPLFIVGRRWNSWYPSFFDVPGGAYAIVCPKNSHGESPTAVIDPGFKFLNVFNKLGISLSDISSCVISHNHPDHIGGIYEFITLRHVLGKKTNIFCNNSTSEMLEKCDTFDIKNKMINENTIYDLLKWKNPNGDEFLIKLRGFSTAHDEMGRHNNTLALKISSQHDIVILGDTQYERRDHKSRFIPNIVSHTIKTVILHLGSSQLKIKTGGHLYLTGLKKILQDMDSHLEEIGYHGKLLVLVSEWGLEHATEDQIGAICNNNVKHFNKVSPILITIRLLEIDLNHIILMPADIGLMIGIDSGDIYFENGERRNPDKVRFDIGISDKHEGMGINYYPL